MTRTAKGQFAKGASGNPGGRPKMPEELKAAMQGLAEDAVRVLQECMQSEDERVRVMAATHILDRGYGKPAQSVNARFEHADMATAHLEALQELIRRRTTPITAAASGSEQDEILHPVGTAD